MGEGDELCGQEEAFKDWAKAVFQVNRIEGGGFHEVHRFVQFSSGTDHDREKSARLM